MSIDKDTETGIVVFVLFVFVVVGFVIASLKTDELEKVKHEKEELEKQIVDLKNMNMEYKWQLEEVPYIIENACRGE